MRFFMAFAAMLCWVGVNAQTITINYEQEGNGSVGSVSMHRPSQSTMSRRATEARKSST